MKSKQRWFVYIIETDDALLYTGITTHLERRFQEHSNGKKRARFFNGRHPKKIVYNEQYSTRSEASRREVEIKKLSRKQKIGLFTNDQRL